jgi:hypothetical protein
MVSSWISLVSLATTINQSLHIAQCVASNTLSEVMVDLLAVSLLPIKPASRVDSEAKRKAPCRFDMDTGKVRSRRVPSFASGGSKC